MHRKIKEDLTYQSSINLIVSSLVKIANSPEGIDLLQLQSFASTYQYKKLYELVNKYLPTNSKMLDWGIGSGHFSYFLCEAGYQTTGFSIYAERTFQKWMTTFPGYKYIQGSLSEPIRLPFPANTFHGVASVGVLEHVRETGGEEIANLREIARILKPNGYFICYHLPNKYSWIEYFSSTFFPHKYHHQYKYTRNEIASIMNKTGFKIVEQGMYGILPRNYLRHLPKKLKYSLLFAQCYNILDITLSFLFQPICQNYYVVAMVKKRINKKSS